MIEITEINRAKAEIKRALKIKSASSIKMETLEICLQLLNNFTNEN